MHDWYLFDTGNNTFANSLFEASAYTQHSSAFTDINTIPGPGM